MGDVAGKAGVGEEADFGGDGGAGGTKDDTGKAEEENIGFREGRGDCDEARSEVISGRLLVIALE